MRKRANKDAPDAISKFQLWRSAEEGAPTGWGAASSGWTELRRWNRRWPI